ncbi:hypothetical protein COJ96_26285 [Bacillus sp. AFS073361]|uniref:hypothetical protein n=1 Tax=Bacillus sp. AFS073361 TaxID=2033511 RepID=UPI000BF306D2|nr:hypothetical protein [Bacillus sp. AFS073361]PFP17615.1 hypothetical protein COJ96_26285 [Bacillus sp. AFS073361]
MFLSVIFYMSIIVSLMLVTLGIKKKNTKYIWIALFLSIISTILSLWSIWMFIIIIPFFCVAAILGITYSKRWFLVFIAGVLAWGLFLYFY